MSCPGYGTEGAVRLPDRDAEVSRGHSSWLDGFIGYLGTVSITGRPDKLTVGSDNEGPNVVERQVGRGTHE